MNYMTSVWTGVIISYWRWCRIDKTIFCSIACSGNALDLRWRDLRGSTFLNFCVKNMFFFEWSSTCTDTSLPKKPYFINLIGWIFT